MKFDELRHCKFYFHKILIIMIFSVSPDDAAKSATETSCTDDYIEVNWVKLKLNWGKLKISYSSSICTHKDMVFKYSYLLIFIIHQIHL